MTSQKLWLTCEYKLYMLSKFFHQGGWSLYPLQSQNIGDGNVAEDVDQQFGWEYLSDVHHCREKRVERSSKGS